MMDYTLKRDKDFKKIFETIPANAKYTSNHIQNEIIELMSKIITEEILHLVVVNAMSSDNKLENLFGVCNSLYKFFRKPTVAAVYTGEKLKRLLEQWWTGHLATVKVIMNSCDDIVHLLQEIEGIPTIGADVRIEATRLLKAITEPSFPFIACMTHQKLGLLDPPNTALQAKSTDLYTGVRLVQSALECVEELRK
ncbi:uncharacterized protein LOC128440739 [Xyrichtys novacula]|uniref:Uncharacterized protein LOC128440739 n=1 Tax=Xyrichtys novacula TaxID=13765 RepID=A0AAV1GZQ7_XYRNO|nr:uncharacterized protein LOC128440739 [Xyrichtys novacula]